MRAAHRSATRAHREAHQTLGKIGATPLGLAFWASYSVPMLAARKVCDNLPTAAPARAEEVSPAPADLLREVLGNPFRPVTINPAWRTPTC